MKHVICRSPNASHLINGIKFQDHDDAKGGIITVEPLDDAAADYFSGINGYEVVEVKGEKPSAAAPPAPVPPVESEAPVPGAETGTPAPAAEKPKGKGGRPKKASDKVEEPAAPPVAGGEGDQP